MGKPATDLTRNLLLEAQAAEALLRSLQLIGVDEDEEDLVLSTVEGETSLIEAVDQVLETMQATSALRVGVKSRMANLKARDERLGQRIESLRGALLHAIGLAGLQKLERPLATVSLRRVAPSVEVTDESLVPSEFFKTPEPKLSLTLIGEALKAGREVPGALLNNGSQTVSIKDR